MNKKKAIFLGVLLIAIMFLSFCAGVNNMKNVGNERGKVAGFWKGLWHGIISPFSFFGSLLYPNKIHFYEVHNNGGWYNFGFVLGAGILFGSGGRSSKS